MKIILLEADSIGKDIDFSPLNQFGFVTSYPTNSEHQTIERIKDADIVILNKTKISEKELEAAPNLKLICVSATGYDNIDIEACKRHNVVVANVKGYSTESVAQYVFAHLLAVYNKVIEYQNDVKHWPKSPMFTMLTHPITELRGKVFGIIGYGNIGKRVAQLAQAFKMRVLIAKRPGVEYNDNFRVDLETVLKKSDVLSIHTPLTPQSRDLITLKELKLMKPTAILINAARGGVVNEQDLYTALKEKIISYAIVDVLSEEPPRKGHIFYKLDNILLTPHIAWTSKEARQTLFDGILDNIKKFLQGEADEINLAN